MMQRWTFQNKVAGGFGVMILLAALTSGIGVYTLHAVIANKDAVISVNAQGVIAAARLQAACNLQSAAFRGYLAWPDPAFLQEKAAAEKDAAELFRRLAPLAYTAEGQRMLSEIRQNHVEFTRLQDRAIALMAGQGGKAQALQLVREAVLPERAKLAGEIDAFAAFKQKLLDAAEQGSSERASKANAMLVGLAIGMVLFAIVAAVLLARSLSRQIGAAVQHVQSSSAELQTSANQQASGAKQTVVSMNEVSTTMSELLATSRQITESAQQVAHIAESTDEAARAGELTVRNTQESIEAIRRQVSIIVSHMLELGKKSQQIGGVLDMINELAEQTNILSINATIEAAGAGEQGKRFAVVGDEIRKLAERVAGSTKEIRALVEEIRGAVNTTVLATEGGSKAVDAGQRQFEEVTRGFKQIADLVVTTMQAAREIELSTKQQMSAVEQANTAIRGAVQVTRENELGSTQTLQTATQLAHLSHELSLIVQSRAAA